MAVGPCVRVCLHFSDLDQETCWFLVDFKKIPTVECMQRMIGRKFYKSEETSFKLTLKGSLLPAWESSFILRDDDQIIVEHEVMAHHSSEYWSKKKKRKKKLMTNSKKFYFSSAKHNSPGCAQRKISKSSIGEDESILAPEPFHNTVSTPDAENEEQKSYKKKKMKLDCVNDLNLDIEELPAPNKKLKISKSSKTEPSSKKKNVMRESKPELIEAVKDRVKVISPRPENLKEEKVNPSDKSDGHLHLKKVKSEIIKVLNKVSVNLDNAIPMETSDMHPNGKDVSNVVNKNSHGGNKNLTQIGDSNEKSLRKDVEPSAKSSVSGLEKSYTVQEESSSRSVQEKVEVYTIEEEDLKNICQSLNDGETLTIDQDKVKVIDVENASNSSWLDCVEVDCSFPEGSRKTDTSAAKETSKGNGNNQRRRRRRRGQRSFACSPFIYAMSQSLDSDADNRSPVSTPVASQLKYPPSSNSSQKHFHFTSDTEEDEEEEEENISQPTMIGVAQSENNFESSKSSLSSEKIGN